MKTLGQIAYEAGLVELLKHGHFEKENGDHSVPTWESICDSKRKAWAVAADSIVSVAGIVVKEESELARRAACFDELLDALQIVVDRFDTVYDTLTFTKRMAIDSARLAIKKAKGITA